MSALLEIINPFAELNETKLHPHARSLRTTFWQKIRDAFFVFHGSFGILDEEKKNVPGKYHLGIVDLPTLGLTYLLNVITFAILRSKITSWIKIPLAIITAICFVVPRIALSAVLTLISAPFVGLSQLITNFVSGGFKQEIKAYETTVIAYGRETTVSIHSLLRAQNAELEDIGSIEYKKELPQNPKQQGRIELTIGSGSNQYYKVSLPVDAKGQLVKEKDQRFFNALRELNIGHIDERIEEADVAFLKSIHQ